MILIICYIIMSVSVVGFGVFLFLDIKYDITKSKPKIYTIPSTKIKTKKEYFYGENIHTPLGEYNPKEYLLDKEPYLGSERR
ncbi:hypothetical protein S231_00960 [Candidatus Phytoplasma solani]|nr:hypothetical protein S231_00960 [Candidatus Phytoplasma solani]